MRILISSLSMMNSVTDRFSRPQFLNVISVVRNLGVVFEVGGEGVVLAQVCR